MQQSDAAALLVKLRARNSSADVQAECCDALSELRLEGDAAADAISAIVAALRHGVDHAALQHAGYCALQVLIVDNADKCVRAVAAGALEAIVAGLRAHPGDAGVQCQGCAALAHIAAAGARARVAAGAAGAVQVIMTALRAHPDDADLQYCGWKALGNITADEAENASNACAAGAVEAAIATLQRRPAQADLLASACHALRALTVTCPDRSAEAGAAGAVTAVVAALQAFPDDMPVQSLGCAALGGILQTTGNRRRGFDSGAGEAILAAMRTHAADQQVQANGCYALNNLFGPDTQASKHAVLAADAIRMIVAAMEAHASVGDVQRWACTALWRLTLQNAVCQAEAAAAGGIEASVAALRAHAADVRVQIDGCDALGSICTHMPRHQAKAALAGGIEAVVQALCRHGADDAELQRAGCGALAGMVLNSRGCVQRANAAGALDAVVASATGETALTSYGFTAVGRALLQLVPGHEAAAIIAGVLEALEQKIAMHDADEEAARIRLIRQLQPAAQQHDARQCTHAGCKRCEAARARGAMCALAGCTISAREGGKKLRRCITCRTARYCSEAHQRDDFQRHRPECFALRDRQAGASDAARS
jgi:hypothetical protein